MKKILALVLVCMFALSGLALAEDLPVLRMATNAEFEPYEYYDDNGVIVGIDAEIAQAICDKLGYELEIIDMDFDSLLAALDKGQADFVMAGLTVTPERQESVDFTDSYATGVQVIIVPEDSEITSVDDLFAEGANHVVGVQLGTTGDIYVSDDIEGYGSVDEYKNGATAVMALLSGKVDCVVIDNEPAKSYVAANEGLKILDTEYIAEDYAAAVKKGSELKDKINDALNELIADGTVQAIVDKYIKVSDEEE